MFNKQTLKTLLNERLSETAEEIFLLFEQAVAEYQRETERLKHVGEAGQLEAVPSPQWTKEVQQEEVAEIIVRTGNGGYFPCEVKTEPSMTQEDEPPMLITNVKSLFNGDELQLRGQEHTANCEGPEASGAAGTENSPETSPEPEEEEDSDAANDEDASRSDTSKETFSCPACKKCFPRIRGLKTHMKIVHPREKQLYNAVCKVQLDREHFPQTQPDVDILIKPLSCTVCLQRYKLQSSLDAHMRAHAEEKPSTCAECGASFPNHSSFISHMREVHSSDKPFRCSVCYRDCKEITYLKVHMRSHTGERPYLCSVCGKGFTISCNLKSHMRTHMSEFLTFRCEKCGNKYKSKTALKQHKRKHFVRSPNVESLNRKDELQPRGRRKADSALPEEQASGAAETDNPETSPEPEDEDSDTANDEDASRSDPAKKTFSCPACKRRFPRIWGLKIHMKKVHPRKKQLYAAVCKDQLDREQFTQTQPDVGILIKPLSCTVCFRRFKLQSSLDAHMRSHAEEKPRTCAKCGASFPNKFSFISHMREVHSTDKLFRCSVCHRDCKELAYLKIHMRIHTGERPYLCSVCGKGFIVSGNLATHMRTHNRIKPFRCGKCGNRYKSKTALKNHKCEAVVLSPKLSLEGAQQTEVGSHEAQAELNKDNTGSSQCNAETEQMMITQEEEPQTLDMNVDRLHRKDELQPRGRQKTNSALPEEQASGAAETDNPETSPEPEDEDSDTANDEDASRSDPAKKTFSCPACKRRFPRIVGLKMHMRMVHPREKQLYAAVCKDQLDREQFTQTNPDVDILIKPLSCTVCFRRFKLQSFLDAHMRAHAEEKPRTCAECGASFPNHSCFISHMREVHSSDKPFRCSVCYRDCKNLAYLKIHMRIHTGERPFVCSVCGKGFIVSGNLATHMRTHNRIKPFRCGKCGNRYKSKTALKNHKCEAVVLSPKLSLEGAQQTEVGSHEAQAELNKDNTGSSQCNAETEQMMITQEEEPQTLDMNVDRLHRKDELQPRGRQKTNSALPEEQASGAAETDNPETSPEPEDEDSDTANDEDASRSDPAKKTFSCPACKRRFPRIKGLKMHMRMVHPREKQLYAAVCKDQLDLEQFTQTQPDVDILIKPLSCTVCFRRFKLQSFLDAHMRAHAEEKPRTCAECGASFPNKSSFISHMREVHSSDKPFRCTVCYRDCKNLTYLKVHMRIHTGERPFVCSVCGKGFIVSGNLATHMRTHNRIKPFRCGKCGNRYKSKTALKNHKCEAVVLNPKLSLEGAQQTEVESHEAQAELNKDNTGSSQYEAATEEMDMQQEKPQTRNTNEERSNRGNDLRPRGQQQKTNNSSDSSSDSEEDDSDTSFDAPKKSFCCPACKQCFPQIRGLKMHMRRAHPGEKQLYAAVCNAKPDSLQRSPSEPDVESDTD